MDKESLRRSIIELLEGELAAAGYELVDARLFAGGGRLNVRVYVDRPGGVDLEACAQASRTIDLLLEESQLLSEAYVIEVSSPGLDRPMKTDRDFERNLGKEIEVTTYEAIDGRKTHEGALIGMDKEKIVIESNGVSTVIPRKSIALARLKIEF